MNGQLAVNSKHVGVQIVSIIQYHSYDKVCDQQFYEAEEQSISWLHLEYFSREKRQTCHSLQSHDMFYLSFVNLFGIGAVSQGNLYRVHKILATGAHLSWDVPVVILPSAQGSFVSIHRCFLMYSGFVQGGRKFIYSVQPFTEFVFHDLDLGWRVSHLFSFPLFTNPPLWLPRNPKLDLETTSPGLLGWRLSIVVVIVCHAKHSVNKTHP